VGDTTDTPKTSVKTKQTTQLMIFVGESHNKLDRNPLKLEKKK